MKILIFSPYYPPHIGGLETHADEFNKYISPHVKKITVFTPRLPFDAAKKETRFGNVEIIRFPAFEFIPNYPLPKFWEAEFWRLFFWLYKQDFDVIISRTRFFFTSILALFYSKTRRIKWIHIEHGSDFVKLHSKLTSLLAKIHDHTFGRAVLVFSDKNIANSKASAQFCKKLSFNKDCEVIYRGVEIEKIKKVQPDFLLKEKYQGKSIITFIGRLIDGKGVHDLLEAVKDVQKEFIVFIIGDGPQRKNLEDLTTRYGIENKVVFFGQKKFEDTISILKISDMFANPSYTEGLPTSVIEAALCKIPIIATDVGGTVEISAKPHFIYPKDIFALKNQIEYTIQNKEKATKKTDLIYEEVKNKFSWEKNIYQYLEIFNNIGNKKIYILSSRSGGPFNQWKKITTELLNRGYDVKLSNDLCGWIRAHFIYGKNKVLMTNIPLFFRFTSKNFILNIKGNYKKERHLFRNPLGYLYGLNRLWSKKIVVPCQYLKDTLALKDAEIIPNGINLEDYQPINIEGKDKKDEIKFITVSKFYFRKKADGVIKLSEIVSKIETEKKITFKIYGYGSLENEIKDKIEKIKTPLNISITFEGRTANSKEALNESDIFLYWSNLDVMPNIFLETMALGLPIVANDFPSFADIIGKHNFIAKNESEMISILHELIENTEKIKASSKENIKYIQNFNIKNVISSWINITH